MPDNQPLMQDTMIEPASWLAGAKPKFLCGAFLGIGCLYLVSCGNSGVYPPGSSVPVEPSAGNWSSEDLDEVVITDLYPYDKDADFESRFTVTGPPVSFAFPKATYASRENAEGGPQSSIFLRLDRQSLKPFDPTRKKLEIADKNRDTSVSEISRKPFLTLSIYSNLFNQSFESKTRYLLSIRPKEYLQSICGFNFWRQKSSLAIYEDLPHEWIADQKFPFGTYAGLAISDDQPARMAECSASSPICLISFEFKKRRASFSIPRKSFCEHEEYVRRITEVLAKHEVDRAQ